MVRLLSLLILLLLPNPFAPRDEIPTAPDAVPPAALAPARPEAVPAVPVRSDAPRRPGAAKAMVGESTPAPADSLPVMADPLEPPTL